MRQAISTGEKPQTREEFRAYTEGLIQQANRASSTRAPRPTSPAGDAESAACRLALTTEEVLALTTTRARAGKCGFSDDHLGLSFADLQHYVNQYGDPAVWKVLGRYLRDLGRQTAEGMGIIIEGTVGTGKTAVMALIAEAEAVRTGSIFEPLTEAERRSECPPRPHLLCVSMVEMADILMQRQRDDAWRKQLEAWRRVTHLCVDDLGTEYLEPFGGNLFYQLIDSRVQKRLPTHFTLNGMVEDLGDTRTHGVNAQRIRSRLLRRNYVLTLAGPDRRTPVNPHALLREVDFV